MNVEEVLSQLTGIHETSSGWQAQCPAHDDQTASLSIAKGDDGRVLLKCHAGCGTKDVVAKIGRTMADLMPEAGVKVTPKKRGPFIPDGRRYDYHDEQGSLLYQVERGTRGGEKSFRQRSPDGNGNWSYTGGRRLVLYRLPELLKTDVSQITFITEGEKDADRLQTLGLSATTSPCGAGKWKPEYNEGCRGRNVVILVDNDKPGEEHALAIAQSLQGVAASVKVLRLPNLPPKGDVSDWLDAHGTVDKLLELVDQCPEFELSTTADTCTNDDSDDAKPKQSQATKLIAAASEACELWHTPEGDAFASVDCGDHIEHHPVRGRSFKRWLQRVYFVASGNAPNAQAMQDAIGVLEGQALFGGTEQHIGVRVAEHDEKVYLDLADPLWRAVEVDITGWRIVDNPPVRFRRPKAMLPLPMPELGDVEELRQHINVRDEDWALLSGWLLASIFPNGPYPLLVLIAEPGSGKSTVTRMLRSTIDPNTAPLRSEPRDPRDLMITASNGWCVTLENISHVPVWLSDALCRLSTGGGFSTRTLYENDEETIFDAKRPVLVNSIDDAITRGDLLDRSVVVNLPTIPEDQRRPESEIWARFNEAAPRILGGLLTAMSVAMRRLPNTRLASLPRMADFALLATAGEPGLGLAEGDFMRRYTANRADANVLALEASPVAKYILEIASAKAWTGTASELLAAINERADEGVKRSKGYPTTPRSLSAAVKRLAPNLRRAGVDVLQDRKPSRRVIELTPMRTEGEFCVSSVICVTDDESPAKSSIPDDANRDAMTQPMTQKTLETPGNDAYDANDAASPLHSETDAEEEFTWSA